MNTTTPDTSLEALPPEGSAPQPSVELIAVPHADELAPSMLSNIRDGFAAAFEQADIWRKKAMAIKVTSLDQTGDMKLARVARLELKAIRVSAEKTRVKLKAESLLMGRAIDGTKAILDAAIVPLETYLEEQENFAAKLIAEKREALISERTLALAPYVAEGQPLPPFADLSPEAFESMLSDYRLLAEAKAEAIRKAAEAEAARVAAEAEAKAKREAEEAAERARVLAENERLRQEAAAAAAEAARIEAAAKAEREAAAEAARIEAARIEAERAAEREAAAEAARIEAARIEAERAAERAAAAKAAQEAAAKAQAERAAMEAKAKAEREAAEKAAAAERAIADAKAAAEREARAKVEAEAKALREAEAARVAAAAKAAAEAERLAKVEAERIAKAARAPDKTKLNEFAAQVRALAVPAATTEAGKSVAAEIAAKVESFARWIETQTSSL